MSKSCSQPFLFWCELPKKVKRISKDVFRNCWRSVCDLYTLKLKLLEWTSSCMSWTVLVVCKVENAGNADRLIAARLFSTIINGSKHNNLCHLFNSLHIYSDQSLFRSRTGQACSLWITCGHTSSFLFICLCAVT